MPNGKSKDYISVRLPEDAGIKDTGTLKVYVLNNKEELIEETSFKGAEAQLKTDADTLREHSRVFIAPELPKELSNQKITAKYLAKINAYEVPMHISNNVLQVIRVPQDLAMFHPWRWCRITGHINKNFIVDGRVQNLPVCHARVRIFEVDRCRLWPRIPDYVFIDAREKLRRIIEEQINPIVPMPPVGPIGPGPVEKTSLSLRSLKRDAKVQERLQIRSLPKLSAEVQAGLLSGSVSNLKEVLLRNFASLHPYLCLWPGIWPWFYCLDEIRTVPTDCNGRFETWYPVFGADQPDIYIEVQVVINGHWTTVYSPSIPCHTWWNYACGSDLNVTITDRRVRPCVCAPLHGSVVWIKSVGSTSLRHIAMHASSPSIPSLFSDARGLTNSTGIEGNNYVSPFSRNFPFVVQFGSGFPSGNITHFRWKYHRIANADLGAVNESFEYQHGSLGKQYTYEGTDPGGNLVIYTNTFPLAESLGSGNIYKIPHVNASVDTGQATAAWNQDTNSITVDAASDDTHNMQNGLYEFVLELCDNHGNVQAVGDNVFQVNTLDPMPSSTPAIGVNPNYLQRNSGQVAGFRFLLRIDNDKTTGAIHDAIVENADNTYSTTDTQCGFAQYKDKNTGNMLLRFDADQLHQYGRYGYEVIKGNSPGAVVSVSGQVPEPVIGVAVVNGISTPYQVKPTLQSLLGNCTQAAFAEHLSVWAYHTDGTFRIDGYDSNDIAAFAIEPV